MKRWIVILLPALIFASPTSQLDEARVQSPAETCAACEDWLHFSDSEIAVCLPAADQEAAALVWSDSEDDIDGDD